MDFTTFNLTDLLLVNVPTLLALFIYFIRNEHRLTKIETHISHILNLSDEN